LLDAWRRGVPQESIAGARSLLGRVPPLGGRKPPSSDVGPFVHGTNRALQGSSCDRSKYRDATALAV